MNIYVGNLSRTVTEAELREAFEAFGQVTSVSIIKDKFSGQPRGFGFVEMPDANEAQAAITGTNGNDLGGQAVRVNQAQPKEDRPRGEGRSRFGGSGGSSGGSRGGSSSGGYSGGGRGGFGGDRGGRY